MRERKQRGIAKLLKKTGQNQGGKKKGERERRQLLKKIGKNDEREITGWNLNTRQLEPVHRVVVTKILYQIRR